MTSTKAPLCLSCKHLDRGSIVLRCSAFPEGVPLAIRMGDFEHTSPYPSPAKREDNGLVYEKTEAE